MFKRKYMRIIWTCQLPPKKGQWDNDYVFYDDGTIEHHYDLSVTKYNLVAKTTPSAICQRDKCAIIERLHECPEEWRMFIGQLLHI